MKHVERIFGLWPLSSRAEKESDILKKRQYIWTKCGRARKLELQKKKKKKRVNDETKNNGQWLERRKKKKNGRLWTAEKHAKRKKWENLVEWQPG